MNLKNIRLLLCSIYVSFLAFAPSLSATPQIETWNTKNGSKVFFVRSDALPMVDVRVVFDAGSARDGNLPGLASFTNAMLSEGAGQWNSDMLAEKLEDRGIKLGSGVQRDMAWLSIRTMSDNTNINFATHAFSKILSKPRFEQESMERLRQQFLAQIKRSEQSLGSIASENFFKTMYQSHPYAHPTQGNLQSIKNISKKNIREFYKNHYVAKNSIIAIVGALDIQKAKKISQAITENLNPGRHASKIPIPRKIDGKKIKYDYPSSQTHIYIGQLGISRYSQDYFPLFVGNKILGGGSLVSILGDEIRNKRGLSYSVYSYFRPMRAQGPFLMVAQTKNDNANKAQDVMQSSLESFLKSGPTEKQLNAAKRNIIGGFPLNIANNSKMVEYISMIGFYDLPIDWLSTLQRKVDAVTSTQILNAFRKHIDPKNNIIILVGGK